MLLRTLVVVLLSLVSTCTNAFACGARKVLYIDVFGNKRIVNEPVMHNGQYLRSCGGSKIAYIDPITGEKIIVNSIVREEGTGRFPVHPN